jgi:hypothetical protein
MPDKPIFSPSTHARNRRCRTLCPVIEFPKASDLEIRQAGLTIIFELDHRRFAIGWNLVELNQKPEELIPILSMRQSQGTAST